MDISRFPPVPRQVPREPYEKARPTWYRNCQFRSRIEARWCIFMDHIGVPWNYEVDTYNVAPGIQYGPDFYLPRQECWLEIKHRPARPHEQRKARLLALLFREPIHILGGPIPDPDRLSELHTWSCWPAEFVSDADKRLHAEWEPDAGGLPVLETEGFRWVQCPDCDDVALTYGGALDAIECGCCEPYFDGTTYHYEQPLGMTRAMREAYIRARSHDFTIRR